MQVIYPPSLVPTTYTDFLVFAGGTIDMGNSYNWQQDLVDSLLDLSGILANPRRLDWDSSWPQDPTLGTHFQRQVFWETRYQNIADVNVYYFADGSASPITLLELGTQGSIRPNQTIVRCTPNYFRYGNVKLFCDDHKIVLVPDLDQVTEFIAKKHKQRMNMLVHSRENRDDT